MAGGLPWPVLASKAKERQNGGYMKVKRGVLRGPEERKTEDTSIYILAGVIGYAPERGQNRRCRYGRRIKGPKTGGLQETSHEGGKQHNKRTPPGWLKRPLQAPEAPVARVWVG